MSGGLASDGGIQVVWMIYAGRSEQARVAIAGLIINVFCQFVFYNNLMTGSRRTMLLS